MEVEAAILSFIEDSINDGELEFGVDVDRVIRDLHYDSDFESLVAGVLDSRLVDALDDYFRYNPPEIDIAENLLELASSFPSEPHSRCSLGEAVTDIVRTVCDEWFEDIVALSTPTPEPVVVKDSIWHDIVSIFKRG